jgi:PAS domain S-box-containing protein
MSGETDSPSHDAVLYEEIPGADPEGASGSPGPCPWPGDQGGLAALLDHLPGFAYRCRIDGDAWYLEYVSGGVEATTGYPVRDLLETRTQSARTIMHPEDQAWVLPELQRTLEARQPYAFEYRIRTAAGETRWVLDKGAGVYEAGKLVGIAGFATDITEHKQADEALAASRDELSALFEGAGDAIFVADAETGLVIDANAAAARLMDLPRERLVGMHQSALHPPDLGAEVRRVFRDHAEGRSNPAELEVLTGDGRRVPVQIVGAAVSFRGGRRVIQGRFRDLTEVRRAEGEAADLRRMLEVMLQTGKAHLAIVAADFTVNYVDPAWREAHGEPGSKTWQEYFAWRLDFGIEEQVRETLEAGTQISRDHLLPGDDRAIVAVTTVPFRAASGERLVAVFESDVTEVRRAADAVRRSEEGYRRLFELESDAIVVMDCETRRILAANQAAGTLYGYSREELLSMTGLDLSAEAERSRQSLTARESYVPLDHHRRRDGSVFPVEVTASYFEEGGRRVCLRAVRDITARIAAETALAESARRLGTLLDNLPGFAFRCRLDPDWTVEYISDGVEELAGYPASVFTGGGARMIDSIIEPEDVPRITREAREAVEARRPYVIRFRIRKATGEVRWLWAKGRAVLDREGRSVAVEGFATDITDLYQAEQQREELQAQLLQAHKMESVGRLAGGVAHDFNNLLTVILGGCEMLENGTRDPAVLADVRQIRKAGERARSLTRQLLAFGRRQVLDLRRTNLARVVAEHVDMLRRLIGEDIRVETALAPDLWDVHCDASQVVQVLVNLAANARDAMPAGGTLALRVENLVMRKDGCAPLPGLAPGDYVLLTVSDTGCGMDSHALNHVFEPFYTTKDVYKGAGLGLATVHGIVGQHGGRIGLESALGRGTTFRIALPRHVGGSGEPRPTTTTLPAAGAGETILLVEDDAEVRRTVESFAGRYGYRVIGAATPAEAIRLAELPTHLDLLVSDVILPEMNGRELYARLVMRRPDLRALFISGYPGGVLSGSGSLDDGCPFLQKPFTGMELAKRIREALNSPARQAPRAGTGPQ